VPEAWGLRGELGPAFRRGLLVAAPVGLILLTQLEFDDARVGALGTAALICGFLAFEAPARVRVRWQLACAPIVGACGALGVLSSQTAVGAIVAMAVVAGVCGYLVAVSLRLAIGGLTFTLALLIAQGLFLEAGDWDLALAYGTAGGLVQALTAAVAWGLWDREREPFRFGPAAREAVAALRANLTVRSKSLRHGLRFGAALAIGVAVYRLTGFDDHGYWVPLTILFVLKPDPDQTAERIAMRAAGTVIGLLLATGLAELLFGEVIPVTIVLTVAAAFAYSLLAIEYALFTTAITVYVVLLTDTLGAGAFEAAGERALGTVLGILVAALAFHAFRDVEERV
jgi:Fusaric acid resistance protein-like